MSQKSKEYQAWKKVLLEILGESATEIIENRVQKELAGEEGGK